MSPLRKKMQDAMVLRGLAARTQESYLAAVAHGKEGKRAGKAGQGRIDFPETPKPLATNALHDVPRCNPSPPTPPAQPA